MKVKCLHSLFLSMALARELSSPLSGERGGRRPWKLETEGWMREAGALGLEAGSWRLDTGDWRLEVDG